MSTLEAFTFVAADRDIASDGYHDFVDLQSAKAQDMGLQFEAHLRAQYSEMTVTVVPANNVNLVLFARMGHADCKLDIAHDRVRRLRGYIPTGPKGEKSMLAEVIEYARYTYTWNGEFFIVFWIHCGFNTLQFILKEPGEHETPDTTSAVTDNLVKTAGDALYVGAGRPGVWVFDRYWRKSEELYEQVERSDWNNIILDEKMKDDLKQVSEKFFDSKDVYKDLGVPWKRGLLFHGPPGNGKTISIKALMRTLAHRKPSVPTLYVRSAPGTGYIGSVFTFARHMAPCMLVLEDVETIVNSATRSYFFNEVDGLENNDGILMVASTNFLDRLDPGLSKRPSRFDRKYLFPLPNEHERLLYAQFWQAKLKNKPQIEFPDKLCPAIAKCTYDFSFAYIQEAFVATLLDIARRRTDIASERSGDGLNRYLLWVVFQEEVKILRKDMNSSTFSVASTTFVLQPTEQTQSPSSGIDVEEPNSRQMPDGGDTRSWPRYIDYR